MLTAVARAAESACAEANGTAVSAVGLQVGSLSGAVPVALTAAWPLVTVGSVLQGAELVVEYVPAAVWCPVCAAERPIDEFYAWRCPECQTPTADLVRGREFVVSYVDLEVPEHE